VDCPVRTRVGRGDLRAAEARALVFRPTG
jgi:hypothetical protein